MGEKKGDQAHAANDGGALLSSWQPFFPGYTLCVHDYGSTGQAPQSRADWLTQYVVSLSCSTLASSLLRRSRCMDPNIVIKARTIMVRDAASETSNVHQQPWFVVPTNGLMGRLACAGLPLLQLLRCDMWRVAFVSSLGRAN